MSPPTTLRVLSYPLPPTADVTAVVAAFRARGPVVALESALPSRDHGGQSLVAGRPRAVLRIPPGGGGAGGPFHLIEELLGRFGFEAPREAPPLGAFGFFGYECTQPAEVARLAPFPDVFFLVTDTVVHWPRPGEAPRLWTADAGLARELVAEIAGAAASPSRPDPRKVAQPPAAGDFSFARYERVFAEAKAALARGDSYQLCFTYPRRRPFRGDPLDLYRVLRALNPAPFAAFVAAEGWAIVSSSPERFLRVDGDGRVEARPMKGTARRPADAAACEAAARTLVESTKNRAENLMIADLLRNDLGRVCRIGSVRATQPALLEEYATVLQLVSVIEGRLAGDATRADLLAAAFPPGSMTGAPKKRSIEILARLEEGPRGPYAGALGYLASDGRMDLSVLIRSILVADGVARVNVGGGIVWDSVAQDEFAETLVKGEALLAAIEACQGLPGAPGCPGAPP